MNRNNLGPRIATGMLIALLDSMYVILWINLITSDLQVSWENAVPIMLVCGLFVGVINALLFWLMSSLKRESQTSPTAPILWIETVPVPPTARAAVRTNIVQVLMLIAAFVLTKVVCRLIARKLFRA